MTETKYFDGAVKLWLPDLLSITTLKTDENGDNTYENTLTATTDYHLYGHGLEDAYNVYPKIYAVINPSGSYSSFANGIRKGVEIAGLWGYGDGISATPYVVDTTITEDLTAGESAIDVTAVTNLSAGNTILINTEQYYIYSISTLTLTVECGVNGTTQAIHTNGASIYIYQYPADIRQACIDLAVSFYQNRGKQGLKEEEIGDYRYVMKDDVLRNILDDSIKSYRRLRA